MTGDRPSIGGRGDEDDAGRGGGRLGVGRRLGGGRPRLELGPPPRRGRRRSIGSSRSSMNRSSSGSASPSTRAATSGATARAGLVDALVHYAESPAASGARAITFLGTEPIRRAADGAGHRPRGRARDRRPAPRPVARGGGLPDGRRRDGRPGRSTQETLVVDVGGGSSEFCVVGPTDPPRASGLKLGSNRLTTRHVGRRPADAGRGRRDDRRRRRRSCEARRTRARPRSWRSAGPPRTCSRWCRRPASTWC